MKDGFRRVWAGGGVALVEFNRDKGLNQVIPIDYQGKRYLIVINDSTAVAYVQDIIKSDESATTTPGGIDLNPRKFDFEIQKGAEDESAWEGNIPHINPDKIQGVTARILSVRPAAVPEFINKFVEGISR